MSLFLLARWKYLLGDWNVEDLIGCSFSCAEDMQEESIRAEDEAIEDNEKIHTAKTNKFPGCKI